MTQTEVYIRIRAVLQRGFQQKQQSGQPISGVPFTICEGHTVENLAGRSLLNL